MTTYGITVMPEYIHSEGVDQVLSRLQRAGIRQVATSPYVMIPTADGIGHREPPVDAGAGRVRLLDRSLWGRDELWFRIKPSFVANSELYTGLQYQPQAATERDTILDAFIAESTARGIAVQLQIMAAIPPALRVQFGGPTDEDLTLLPDGTAPSKHLAKNGSLASPEILAYTKALSRDLLTQYPDVRGIRFDWPEYPCYHLQTAFIDFNAQAAAMCTDYAAARQAAADWYATLHNLDDSIVSGWEGVDPTTPYQGCVPGPSHPLAKLKRKLVSRYIRELTDTVHACERTAIMHAFPPPFSDITGFDFAANSAVADSIGMKLYTMHLPMILHHYGEQLLEWNPGLDQSKLAAALNRRLDLGDSPLPSLDDYRYPSPDTPHQVTSAAQVRKIQTAAAQAANVHTMVHTYGPVEDFAERLRLSAMHSPDGIWLNRYAYLSDEKLEELAKQQREWSDS
jgi:hypothetical protein